MADRIAPGGNTTISLGSDSAKDVFAERQKEREADFETPDAVARFPHAPGGFSTISLGGAPPVEPPAARGPVGGASAIVLGEDNAACERQREANFETPEALPRFPHAPGGTSSVCLGGSEAPTAPQAGTGLPVGGAATISLGSESSESRFADHRTEVKLETPDAAPRFPQAPGGHSSIVFAGTTVQATAVRGPVGGMDSTGLVLAGSGGEEEGVTASRGPVGGEATICLGSDSSREVFEQRERDQQAPAATPDAAARFPQAPGGSSTVQGCFGGEEGSADAVAPSPRGPIGGASTITSCLGGEGSGEVSVPAVRGPVGGATSVVLGGDNATAVFEEWQRAREAPIETPDALSRFPQPTGGSSSIALGGEATAEAVAPTKGPVGGETTVVLGGEDSREMFSQRRREREAEVDTPEALARFPQAPGGCATIDLGNSRALLAAIDEATATGPPVGGPATIVLGSEDSKATFLQAQQQREAGVDTPDAAPRFPQAPGGSSSLVLGAAIAPEEAPAVRGPVGGQTSLLLGEGSAAEAFQQYQDQHNRAIATPDAAPRFQQAPGGTASINFSPDGAANPMQSSPTRGPVGGADTVVLGADSAAEDFRERQSSREGVTATPEAVPRFSQAPGGTASVILGGDGPDLIPPLPGSSRAAPGGPSTLVFGGDYPHEILERVSANKFANGANQNAGNTITDRPTTRIHHAPGGASTICLGDEPSSPTASKVSSNAFASGANQNSGNTITDRPTTRLHQAPGGDSSLVLGGGYPHDLVEAALTSGCITEPPLVAAGPGEKTEHRVKRLQQSPGGNSTICLGDAPSGDVAKKVSSNKFANGSSQNVGNTITDRPSTRLHQAPGGDSTICLGEEGLSKVADENVDTMNLMTSSEVGKEPLKQSPTKQGGADAAAASPVLIR